MATSVGCTSVENISVVSRKPWAERRQRLAAFTKRVFVVGLAALLAGCSSPGGGDSDAREGSEGLIGTTTITLKAPNSVPVLTPTIGALNSVWLGAGSQIVSGSIVAMGSGGVHAEPEALLNETWSRGAADLRDRVWVRGTLHATTRTLGNNVQIPNWDFAPIFDPNTTLTWKVKYPTQTTGPAVTLNSGQSQTLSPGQFGVVTLNSGAALTLRAGTYYLKTLTLEAAAVIKLDQTAGPVIIYIDTNFVYRGTVVPLTGSAPPDLLVVHLGTTPFALEKVFNGAVVAPFTTITLRAVPEIHTGYFYAKDVKNHDAHARIQYRAPWPIIPATNPPDNASCSELVQSLSTPSTLKDNLARYCKACPTRDDTDRDLVPDCLDGCPYDKTKTRPGRLGCGVVDTDDGDGDKIPDPIDLCPDDPNNTSPGQCGCVEQPGLKPAGTPCTDTACPQPGAACDGQGVCGDPTACMPASGCQLVTWRSSSYWLCVPQAPDGGTGGTSGTGGSAGSGGTSGSSGSGGTGGTGGGPNATPVNQGTAHQLCSAKGEALLRIDSPAENRFITSLLTGPVWLGANDISVVNSWRWAATGTNNGDPFWSGGPTGVPVGSRFANWTTGAPGATQRCATLVPDLGGRWVDTACTQLAGYICEFHVQYVDDNDTDDATGEGGDLPPPGRPRLPFPRMSNSSCVPSAAEAGLPDSYDELRHDVDASAMGIAEGAAANPPPPDAGACPEDPLSFGIGFDPDPKAGCKPTTVIADFTCLVDDDCTVFGAGFICRQQKDDPSCTPANTGVPTDAGQCEGHARCMQVTCPVNEAPCDQRDICEPGTEVTAVLDPVSTLDSQEVSTDDIFQGTPPTATPTGEYLDPATGSGTNHSWCFLQPQDPQSVKPANGSPSPPYQGKSGGDAMIQFQFDPSLVFEANPGILPLGESDLSLHAAAGLTTRVVLADFLGQSFNSPIFEASIGLKAERCSINTKDDTQFRIFGLDVLSGLGLGVPELDSRKPDSPLYGVSKACDDSLGKYVLFADRAKKAFRDAQQLVHQYNAAKESGSLLSGDLCNQLQVAAANVPFFPGGNNCPSDEPVEITINRFVDYYQAPGFGQIAKLKDAHAALADATAQLKGALSPSFGFGGEPHEESQTILNVQFFIGPVPMVLQIDVFAQYGVGGAFELSLDLPSLLVEPASATPRPIAKIDARVVPFAGAGLSAFVGAGLDLGPIAATIGIEGRITLAEVSAPIFAGVGLEALPQKDARPMPDDVLSAALNPSALHFPDPKSFKFFVSYEYGAGVDINNVLSGEINGKLRIKFFFFSRTWRKRVIKFNGWSQHFDLIKGSSDPAVSVSKQSVDATLETSNGDADTAAISTDVAAGTPTMGLTEAQVPLAVLQEVPLADGAGGAGGALVSFDATQVESMFYDSLCCMKVGDYCQPGSRPQCCPGSTCVTPAVEPGTIPISRCEADEPSCIAAGDTCTSEGAPCCEGSTCFGGVCAQSCLAYGDECNSDSPPCCNEVPCTGGLCRFPTP